MLKNRQEDLIVAEEACVEEGQSGACLVKGSNKQCLLAVSSLELVETVYHSMSRVPTLQQSIPQYIIVIAWAQDCTEPKGKGNNIRYSQKKPCYNSFIGVT